MNTKCRLYIAYGSNLNLEQMKRRCPTAEVVGTAELKNWRLRFRGGSHSAVATIEREQGFTVPVLIWRIQPEDEVALNRYEGFPFLYRKETLRLTVNGKRVRAMVYIMNETGHPYGAPLWATSTPSARATRVRVLTLASCMMLSPAPRRPRHGRNERGSYEHTQL